MPTEVIKPNSLDEDNTKSPKSNIRQQILNNKFAMAADKHTHSLRRDLLLSNFDRNMTVEKARFEPTGELIDIQPTPVAPTTSHLDTPKVDVNINEDVINNSSNTEVANSPPAEMTYALTMSPSAPTLTTSSNGTVLINAAPLTNSHSMSDRRRLAQVRSEVIITIYC